MRLQLPENLIEGAEIRSLVFFARCKGLYRNNTIYAYNPRKLAQMLGCSVGKVRYNIKALQKEGLIRFTNNNKTFGKVSQRHKCTIIIEKGDTDKEIKYKIYAKLLERNVGQQIWITEKKAEARNKHQVTTLKQLKTINKRIKYGLLEKPHNPNITLSVKSISSILGVSPRTSVKVKEFLSNKGYATFKTTKEKIGKMSFRAFLYSRDLFPSSYWYKGVMYKPNPSIVYLSKYY